MDRPYGCKITDKLIFRYIDGREGVTHFSYLSQSPIGYGGSIQNHTLLGKADGFTGGTYLT